MGVWELGKVATRGEEQREETRSTSIRLTASSNQSKSLMPCACRSDLEGISTHCAVLQNLTLLLSCLSCMTLPTSPSQIAAAVATPLLPLLLLLLLLLLLPLLLPLSLSPVLRKAPLTATTGGGLGGASGC